MKMTTKTKKTKYNNYLNSKEWAIDFVEKFGQLNLPRKEVCETCYQKQITPEMLMSYNGMQKYKTLE